MNKESQYDYNYHYDKTKNSFQPPYKKQLTVEVGTETPLVIAKMFGPMIFCDVRVTAIFRQEDQEPVWRVERKVLGYDTDGNNTESWEIMLDIPCQESIELYEDWEEKQKLSAKPIKDGKDV